jgi:allophanate hydrolase
VVPACRTLDTVSIFANTVADAAHVLSLIEGADAADPYSHFMPGPASLPRSLRLGVPRQPDVDPGCGYAAAWAAAVGRAEAAGHRVVAVDFSLLDEVAALLYEGPWVAERHAACRDIIDHQPEAMDATVRTVISRAIGMSATDTFEAQYRLRTLQVGLSSLWGEVDALMVPTAPGHPTFADVDADPVGSNARLGRYTNFVNLLGWSALALPAGRTAGGLPFGITLIARGHADAALVAAGRAWESGAHDPMPDRLRSPATEPTLALAVVGAHLSGLPLNGQLIERGATLVQATTTAAAYRLYALPGTTPPKPGMVRVAEGGAAIAVEVWDVPQAAVGSFLALIPSPLGLGSVQLADGRHVHGFLCEPHALAGAQDITHHGGWRAFMSANRTAA